MTAADQQQQQPLARMPLLQQLLQRLLPSLRGGGGAYAAAASGGDPGAARAQALRELRGNALWSFSRLAEEELARARSCGGGGGAGAAAGALLQPCDAQAAILAFVRLAGSKQQRSRSGSPQHTAATDVADELRALHELAAAHVASAAGGSRRWVRQQQQLQLLPRAADAELLGLLEAYAGLGEHAQQQQQPPQVSRRFGAQLRRRASRAPSGDLESAAAAAQALYDLAGLLLVDNTQHEQAGPASGSGSGGQLLGEDGEAGGGARGGASTPPPPPPGRLRARSATPAARGSDSKSPTLQHHWQQQQQQQQAPHSEDGRVGSRSRSRVGEQPPPDLGATLLQLAQLRG